jgi:hypothetical protein
MQIRRRQDTGLRRGQRCKPCVHVSDLVSRCAARIPEAIKGDQGVRHTIGAMIQSRGTKGRDNGARGSHESPFVVEVDKRRHSRVTGSAAARDYVLIEINVHRTSLQPTRRDVILVEHIGPCEAYQFWMRFWVAGAGLVARTLVFRACSGFC